jgi:photosystem II stability/assembly factor-like uncharacterized protein
MVLIHSVNVFGLHCTMRIKGSLTRKMMKGYFEGSLTCGTVQRNDDDVSQWESRDECPKDHRREIKASHQGSKVTIGSKGINCSSDRHH